MNISRQQLIETINLFEVFKNNYKSIKDVKVVLCGAGIASLWYIRLLLENKIKVSAILDNCKDKAGTDVHIDDFDMKKPIPIVDRVDYLNGLQETDNLMFVISAPKYRRQIRDELQLYGISSEQIYSFESEIYCNFIKSIPQYRQMLSNNYELLCQIYDLLEDCKSKEVLEHFILGRLSGDLSYFESIKEDNQYLPSNIFEFGSKEVVADVGAYIGDSLLLFYENLSLDKVYCFEPDRNNLEKLHKVKSRFADVEVEIIEAGAWSITGELTFLADKVLSETSKLSADGENVVNVVRLDDVITDHVTYIKMDIEGSEYEALLGAENIIR